MTRAPWSILALPLVLALGCERVSYEVEIETYSSALHPIQITRFRMDLPGPPGGGIQLLGTGFLAATGGGDLYWFERTAPEELEIVKLPHRIPMEREAFRSWAANHEEEMRSHFSDTFRVNDLLVQEKGDRVTVFASATYWREAETCYGLRVSTVTLPPEALLDEAYTLDWGVLFETDPCLPIKKTGHGFAGQQAGGEMIFAPDGKRILLSIGDFEFDGLNDPRNVSQDLNSPYGKLLWLDPQTGDTELVAWGVRNAQGLAFDELGRIWETEHGPQGGDELNQIVAGENYGWPYVTYGTQYGRFDWPLAQKQSEHKGFAAPIFSWVPSVGTSDLLMIQGRGFAEWSGDLLLAALKPGDLLRIRIRQERVAYIETIPVDTRARDMVEDQNGAIVLWTDNPDLRFLEVAGQAGGVTLSPIARGNLLYAECRGCHPIESGAPAGIAPNLVGIVGRKIASEPGYAYSASLRAKKGHWGKNRLNQYLQNPQAFASGTSMNYPGLKSASDRESLIAYLEAQTP